MSMSRPRRVKRLPCIACRLLGVKQTETADAHHMKYLPDGVVLKRGHKKAENLYTIPLCPDKHHWNGAGVNMAYSTFVELVGYTEPELWEITNQWLEEGLDEAESEPYY